jgi:hypothetical protein
MGPLESFIAQSAINVVNALFKYVKGFDYIKNDPLLQHHKRRALPKGHKTKYYCLRASTIEEASIQGNILVHDDIYRVQLKLDADDPIVNTQAIPTINDQLTNARIRGAQAMRAQDVSFWEQRRIFQISFGVFHLVMNLIWALLQNHRGTTNVSGKSKLEYMQRHEQIIAYQSITFSGGRHGSVIVYNRTVRMITLECIITPEYNAHL